MRAVMPAISFVQSLCGDTAGLWTFDLWITLPLLLSAALYGTGVMRLWSHAGVGRGIHGRQLGCYIAGWIVLVFALVSPIHRWGTGLFSIHMVEHELVMAVAAPLLALGRPGTAFAWALPVHWRRGLPKTLRRSGIGSIWGHLTRPVAATSLHGVAIWAWHAPALFDAAVAEVTLHRLQHVSFLGTGFLFWWALLRHRNAGLATAHLFATMLHTSLLGAVVALAPRVLYRLQTERAADWGMTPLQDQQLAGLLMWVPAGLVYAGAALLFFALWVKRSGNAKSAAVNVGFYHAAR
jgi:cytochrome c oxidase assembly factor CtaG